MTRIIHNLIELIDLPPYSVVEESDGDKSFKNTNGLWIIEGSLVRERPSHLLESPVTVLYDPSEPKPDLAKAFDEGKEAVFQSLLAPLPEDMIRPPIVNPYKVS